jgi:hypothetical protein
MEKMLTTTKGHVHQKSIEQAGKGACLATRKATKTESTEKITVGKEKN